MGEMLREAPIDTTAVEREAAWTSWWRTDRLTCTIHFKKILEFVESNSSLFSGDIGVESNRNYKMFTLSLGWSLRELLDMNTEFM